MRSRKYLKNPNRFLPLLAAIGFASSLVSGHATTVIWNGPGAGNNSWSIGANWSGGVVPGATDNASFTNNGAVGAGVINNVVDASTSINGLWYGATVGAHTTLINPDQVLTITGTLPGIGNSPALNVGLENYVVNNQAITAALAGAEGTLNINSPTATLQVRQGFGSGTATTLATLDMSGLGTLRANIIRIQIGVESGTPRRVAGVVYLARTNYIVLFQTLNVNSTFTSGSPSLYLGHNTQAGNANGSVLYLGVTNAIFGNYFVIGRGNQVGNLVAFNPAFLPEHPAAFFRGSNNVNRVGVWTIGDNSAGSLTTSSAGTNDFSGGTVDAMVDFMAIGRGRDGNTVNTGIGVLTYDGGVFDVNTLRLGSMVDVSTATGASGVGTVNVNGTASLVVNTVLELGHVNTTATPSAGAIAGTAGTLNANGGVIRAPSIIDGGGTSTINLGGGSIELSGISGSMGSLANPIDNLGMTNSSLALAANALGPKVVVGRLTTGGDSNIVNISRLAGIQGYPTQFVIIKYSGTIGGAGFNFGLGTMPPSVPAFEGYMLDNSANGSVDLVITNGPPPAKTLTWNGASSADWDTVTPNWTAASDPFTIFNHGDFVLFDESSTVTTVNLAETLLPGSLNISNRTLTYLFMGSGNLSGESGLTKDGGGLLVMDNTGINNYSGPTIINDGTVQVGNNDAAGSLGAGSISNNAVLAFNRPDNIAVANAISGRGAVAQWGTGTLTLGGNNIGLSGQVIANNGTLKVASSSALGDATGTTVVIGGATLDLNAQSLGAERVSISGDGVNNQGAIINSSGQQLNALRFVTLEANASLGGPGNFLGANNPGRWDIRAGGSPAAAGLSTGGNPFSLTKVGSNQISLVGVTVDSALGDIVVQQGLLGFETSTTSMGNPAGTLQVSPGAVVSFFNTTALWNKFFVLNGDGVVPSLTNWSGSNTIVGPVLLNGDCVIGVGGTALFCNGAFSGTGNLIKHGAAPMTLNGANDYSGSTTLSNGTLFVDGSHVGGGSVTVQGGTLAGVGLLSGPTVVNTRGTISPGNLSTPMATLQIAHDLTLLGTNVMDVQKSNGAMSCDVISQVNVLSLGGTLRLNLGGEALVAGDAIPLYAAGSITGSFSSIVPATPGPGLIWDSSQFGVDGSLRVAVPPQPGIAAISVTGTELVISGTNGIGGSSYYVLSATNIVEPVANWTLWSTNVFDSGGNFSFTNTIDPATPQRFLQLRLP